MSKKLLAFHLSKRQESKFRRQTIVEDTADDRLTDGHQGGQQGRRPRETGCKERGS